jgi:2-oxoglutarate ferredoxin oxidoreductase subunit alpha
MGEGISLAGGMESPMVIHLAQRPGPATGLPTRTEQGDLDLALYAGHGEFPRAILAPGTLEDAFDCARQAFALADASQSPVILLTDQYLLDSSYNAPALPIPVAPPEHRIVETTVDYRRYAHADSGLSPRGIPGFGRGLVCTDSDEHDEAGFITERSEVRVTMVDKRLKKLALLRGDAAVPHRLFGPANYQRLLVGWGSTRPAIKEALARVADPKTAFLHCPQVYPLTEEVQQLLLQAQRLIVIENNATAQFARLIQRETGRRADADWLQYDGMPFSVENLETRLRQEVTL